MKHLLSTSLVCALAGMAVAETVPLSSLNLKPATAGWGVAVPNASCTTTKLSIAGAVFTNGVGVHATSVMHVKLAGGSTRFRAVVGVDDDNLQPKGNVTFAVYGDGKKLFASGPKRSGEKGEPVDVDVTGLQTLTLLVADGGDGIAFDHANWADANFEVTGAKPELTGAPVEEAVILTPPPGPAPRINGPKIYGARPGHPFLYRIPCTGERPMKFAAMNLPEGIALDPATGILRGTTPAQGEYAITFTAENAKGRTERAFKLVAGDTLSLTPQMGYNHWYAHYNRITQKMMEEAADVLLSSGMADAGYEYVNVDDCWMKKRGDEPYRDADGAALPNKDFPDMKALADYIHARGLKAGLYTSPGPWTCGGYVGAHEHEAAEVKRYAEWGYDFLKYDWCSYSGVAGRNPDLAAMQKPYRLIGDLLRQQNRDMVLNLCQYGMGDVWKWGKEIGGQSWRTGGDLGFELHRIHNIALRNVEIGAHNGPGGWNDPDYIQIGYIGAAHGMGLPKPCPLTPNEQYSFMSMWCLLPAPLFFSGDMTRLDPFTLGILCSPELIEVNQDALGRSARAVKLDGDTFLMVKELEGGALAVGFCNKGELPVEIAAKWSDLGVSGKQAVRDLWRQKDLGVFEDSIATTVPRHGTTVFKFTPAR